MCWNICKRPSKPSVMPGESEHIRLGENAPAVPAVGLGHGIQTQIYRQVLLSAITELWVDYLTRVEALRVSVGLEAYAQADPLVKYKSQASEMFQSLTSSPAWRARRSRDWADAPNISSSIFRPAKSC